jgi:hypothetical protein
MVVFVRGNPILGYRCSWCSHEWVERNRKRCPKCRRDDTIEELLGPERWV